MLCVCRTLNTYWDQTFLKYINGLLPGDFFTRSGTWLQRADSYRQLVEAVDITNYYRQKLYTKHALGEAHYLESNNRPARYVFIQKMWADEHPPEYPMYNSVNLAAKEAEAADSLHAEPNVIE